MSLIDPSVLHEALELINGQRQKDYGTPRESFQRTADLWSPILGIEVTPEQVVLCMIALKLSRLTNGYHRDSVVDVAGYAGVLAMVHDGETDAS